MFVVCTQHMIWFSALYDYHSCAKWSCKLTKLITLIKMSPIVILVTKSLCNKIKNLLRHKTSLWTAVSFMGAYTAQCSLLSVGVYYLWQCYCYKYSSCIRSYQLVFISLFFVCHLRELQRYCYVEFGDPLSAQGALNALNNKPVPGTAVSVPVVKELFA